MPPKLPPRRPVLAVPPVLKDNEGESPGSRDTLTTPPIPPKWSRPNARELARLLARPPPVPIKSKNIPIEELEATEAPRRHLPPLPSRLPTPPPEPERAAHEDHGQLSLQGSCLECYGFTHVDQHAACFPRHTVIDLDTLALNLTEPFISDIEKARAIFTWLHHNIAYDTVSFFSGNLKPATANSTLSSGLAVCDGYAGLFQALAERVGIYAIKVTGHGKGVGYEATRPDQPVPAFNSNHAWNCVYLDGEWRLIDACWGSGALEGTVYRQRFNPAWFTSTPAQFVKCHFPEDACYQLIPEEEGGPISWCDYIMEPAGPIIYSSFYDVDLLPSSIQPAIREIGGDQMIYFHVSKRCEHMSTLESENFVYILSFAHERVPLELDGYGGWGANTFIPRGIQEVSLQYVQTVSDYDAKGIGIDALRQAFGRKAMSFAGLAKWTIV